MSTIYLEGTYCFDCWLVSEVCSRIHVFGYKMAQNVGLRLNNAIYSFKVATWFCLWQIMTIRGTRHANSFVIFKWSTKSNNNNRRKIRKVTILLSHRRSLRSFNKQNLGNLKSNALMSKDTTEWCLIGVWDKVLFKHFYSSLF